MKQSNSPYEQLGYKSSDDFPIYLKDVVKCDFSLKEGVVTTLYIEEDLRPQVGFFNELGESNETFKNEVTSRECADLKLLKKGERDKLPVINHGYELVRDVITGTDVLIISISLYLGGCVNYQVTRTGVDKNGKKYIPYSLEQKYAESINHKEVTS